MVKRSAYVFDGSAQEFGNIFFSQTNLLGEHLFCATEEEVCSYMLEKGRKRKRIPGPTCLHMLLTPPQLARLKEHRRHASQTLTSDSWVADVSQEVRFSKAGHFVPTLLTSSELWSEKARRPAIVREHFVCQGIPASVGTGAALVPWADFLKVGSTEISDTDFRTLVGNAMHRAVVGHLALYILSGLHPTAALRVGRCHRLETSVFESSDENGDEGDIE